MEVLKRLHAVLALPPHLWEKRSDEAGVSIALHTPPNSPHVMVRSEVTIRMAPERVFAFYMVNARLALAGLAPQVSLVAQTSGILLSKHPCAFTAG